MAGKHAYELREIHNDGTVAEVLCGFTFANDLAFGLAEDDSLRAAHMAIRIAQRLALSPAEQQTVYYAALLKDAGCTSWTSELAAFWEADEIAGRREFLIFGGADSMPSFFRWLTRYVATDFPLHRRIGRALAVVRRQEQIAQEGFEATRDVAMRIAARLRMPEEVRAAARSLFEQWDGKGMPDGLAGTAIPLASRVIHPTFALAPVGHRFGREAALALARERRGKGFDPDVADAFIGLAGEDGFWESLESGDLLVEVLRHEPPLGALDVDLDEVALAFADFADLKVPAMLAHSRRTAVVAEAIARGMRLGDARVIDVRRAALLHDLGLVAVPSWVLGKPAATRSAAEREQVRLHPYHSERLLTRIPALASLAPIVGAHHEHADGGGYYRGLTGEQTPLEARIVSAAVRFDELLHPPDAEARDPAAALDLLRAEAAWHDAAVLRALEAAIGASLGVPGRAAAPAGLTDREIEVLRLAARGMTRRTIATRLGVTENTVRHHLEHIYNKVGVSNRVAAAMFAVEQGLLD